MYQRVQNFREMEQESGFLWGARQTGKSTLLKTLFPDSLWFDLLLSDVFERLNRNPAILRETVLGTRPSGPVVIDEIQRIPGLLNEVQWLMVNNGTRFILSGSSPRRILRAGANLLGGRALRYELYPLIYKEIDDFELARALNHGFLPRIYQSANPARLISAYIGNYLQDEILTEARVRNLQAFSRFLEVAALSNGEIVNFSGIATECGVSAPTVKAYFQILEETLIGRFLPSFRKKPKRRVIQAPKFFYFDLSIPNHFLRRRSIEPGTEPFGKVFEHFIYQEIYAHRNYSGLDYPFSYWRTASGLEVDFILGEPEVAIEVKAGNHIHSRHGSGLRNFAEEYQVKQLIIVCNEPYPRQMGKVSILPWQTFLDRLWAGEIIH